MDKLDNKYNPFLAKTNENTKIENVIAVISGKGGVGTSFVSSVIATLLNKNGYQVGIIDGDITGPSIPKAFGLKGALYGKEKAIDPLTTRTGIKVVSTNFLLENDEQPVIWRGSLITGMLKQFYTDVNWGNLDYLIVDCPPGTGDVPLTVFQSLPIKGIVVVTSPQELVSTIVKKAVNMANMMSIPILGIVENMSYFDCDKCGKRHYIYGESHVKDIARENDIDNVVQVPINKEISTLVDNGKIEAFDYPYFNDFILKLIKN